MNLGKVDLAVIGAGPAGLGGAIEAASHGVSVMLIDENARPGGQLFKQIHKFFGSREHGAGTRGLDLGTDLLEQARRAGVEVRLNTVAAGLFEGRTLALTCGERLFTLETDNILIATGATENALSFPGWTLPGVMGAGAAQTMMHLHRVKPGTRVLMVGSGNVGLIVSYQLLQALSWVPRMGWSTILGPVCRVLLTGITTPPAPQTSGWPASCGTPLLKLTRLSKKYASW